MTSKQTQRHVCSSSFKHGAYYFTVEIRNTLISRDGLTCPTFEHGVYWELDPKVKAQHNKTKTPCDVRGTLANADFELVSEPPLPYRVEFSISAVGDTKEKRNYWKITRFTITAEDPRMARLELNLDLDKLLRHAVKASQVIGVYYPKDCPLNGGVTVNEQINATRAGAKIDFALLRDITGTGFPGRTTDEDFEEMVLELYDPSLAWGEKGAHEAWIAQQLSASQGTVHNTILRLRKQGRIKATKTETVKGKVKVKK